MKAALDVVLFFVTLYDHWFGKGEDEPQPDIPNDQIEGEYPERLLTGYQRFHSEQQDQNKNNSFFDFNEEEDDIAGREVYARLADDELGRWQKDKEEQLQQSYAGSVKNGFSKFWNSTSTLMSKYAKRRTDLNQQTIKSSETLTNVQDFIAQKKESIQMRVSKYMYARRAMKEMGMSADFGKQFVTL